MSLYHKMDGNLDGQQKHPEQGQDYDGWMDGCKVMDGWMDGFKVMEDGQIR